MGSLGPGLGRRGGRGDENPAPTGEGPIRGKKTEMIEPVRNNGLCPFSDSELQTVVRRAPAARALPGRGRRAGPVLPPQLMVTPSASVIQIA